MARPTSTPMPQAYRAPFEATSSSDAILMNSDFRGWLICIPRIHRTAAAHRRLVPTPPLRSEEHTSELQSLMRISYAVFCLTKKKLKRTAVKHYFTQYKNQINHQEKI